jgi:hypothetical protein
VETRQGQGELKDHVTSFLWKPVQSITRAEYDSMYNLGIPGLAVDNNPGIPRSYQPKRSPTSSAEDNGITWTRKWRSTTCIYGRLTQGCTSRKPQGNYLGSPAVGGQLCPARGQGNTDVVFMAPFLELTPEIDNNWTTMTDAIRFTLSAVATESTCDELSNRGVACGGTKHIIPTHLRLPDVLCISVNTGMTRRGSTVYGDFFTPERDPLLNVSVSESDRRSMQLAMQTLPCEEEIELFGVTFDLSVVAYYTQNDNHFVSQGRTSRSTKFFKYDDTGYKEFKGERLPSGWAPFTKDGNFDNTWHKSYKYMIIYVQRHRPGVEPRTNIQLAELQHTRVGQHKRYGALWRIKSMPAPTQPHEEIRLPSTTQELEDPNDAEEGDTPVSQETIDLAAKVLTFTTSSDDDRVWTQLEDTTWHQHETTAHTARSRR